MATRINSSNSPITEAYINIIVCFLSLEYLILRGIRRVITNEKPVYSLSDFLTGDISMAKVIFA